MSKLVNERGLKPLGEILPGSSPGTGTIRWKVSSSRQKKQQRLWQALGTVTGFHGYLHNLRDVTKRATKGASINYALHTDGLASCIERIKYQLYVMEEQLRKELHNIK